MIDVILIGSSKTNEKIINISNNFENNKYVISKTNWTCDYDYDHSFEVTINDGNCIIKRMDREQGWEMNLIINANVKCKFDYDFIDIDNNNIPLFFINLEKDKKRLHKFMNTFLNIFEKNNIHRVNGVNHAIGMEGCRLAHIEANMIAINNGYPYYLIAEDDISPLIDSKYILSFINNSIKTNPDLVLFEIGQNLENRISLEFNQLNPNLYRIFYGGNNSGCYLCSRDFGIKLVKNLMNNPGMHVDKSWECLWKDNKVFFHRPQLFHQIEGFSNQNDVLYRHSTKPFDWKLYENIKNKKLLNYKQQ